MSTPLGSFVLALTLAACTKGPLPQPNATADAGAASATSAAASARVSHREELLREASTTGLDVVFQGWLEPRADLGAASADTCLRVRVAEPATADADAARSDALTLTEHEGDSERTSTFSTHEGWTAPTCVRRGIRVTLAAGETVEIVVVASAAFR